MIARWMYWVAGALLIAVIAAAVYFPALRNQVEKATQLTEKTAEQARRELLPVTPVTSGEPKIKAKMYWGSGTDDGMLKPVVVELPLSDDPVARSKQVLNTLLAGPVNPEARTLPSDAALLAFYLLPDGLAVADFSEAIGTSIPSGIQSEQLRGGLNHLDSRSQCAASERTENSDSWSRSRYARGASRSDTDLSG